MKEASTEGLLFRAVEVDRDRLELGVAIILQQNALTALSTLPTVCIVIFSYNLSTLLLGLS